MSAMISGTPESWMFAAIFCILLALWTRSVRDDDFGKTVVVVDLTLAACGIIYGVAMILMQPG